MVRAEFTDTSRPVVKLIYPNTPYYYLQGHSNICDSASGRPLFSCNGMILYDSNGVIMDNGDSLVPPNAYNHTVVPAALYTQSSLILPKGSNGEFYVFICTITDAKYNYWNTNFR
ncbi:MAG: hypothetical protein HWD58_07685 [Bacteroidota bacterium]|nr:MAG: hypothetical protein HWD58_07685 [Bacteroidota bacterium]